MTDQPTPSGDIVAALRRVFSAADDPEIVADDSSFAKGLLSMSRLGCLAADEIESLRARLTEGDGKGDGSPAETHRGCAWHRRWLELANVTGKRILILNDEGREIAQHVLDTMASIEIEHPHGSPAEGEREMIPKADAWKYCVTCAVRAGRFVQGPDLAPTDEALREALRGSHTEGKSK